MTYQDGTSAKTAPVEDPNWSNEPRQLVQKRESCPLTNPKEPKGVSRTVSRSTRIPEDLTVTDEMRQWATSKGIRSNLDHETERFIDYYVAKGDTRVDWVAAWRNWIRNADKYLAERADPTQSKSAAARARVRAQLAPELFDGSTSATQTRSVLNGINNIESLRYASPTGIWVHPRRANSWAYAADSATAGSGRPLYVGARYGTFNDVGIYSPTPVPEGLAGEMFGLPVIKDANMPITMNSTATTGGTADPVVVVKEDDLLLFEGQLKLRALPEILSGTLQVRLQAYCYSAFICSRFLPSISILTGNTGLAAPGW